jgi:two-component system response regulator NreC
MSSEKPLRLIVVDDHEAIITGIRVAVARCKGLQCIGSAADGFEALEIGAKLHPDVVIMDITMPRCDGLEATARFRKQLPDSQIMAYSFHPQILAVLAILRAGALGFVCKSSPLRTLIEAIPIVAQGKRFIDPQLSDPLLRSLLNDEPFTPPSVLTNREHEVLLRVAWGFTCPQIGAELSLSSKTVEAYRARACDKLELSGRPAIIRYALMAGWLDDQAPQLAPHGRENENDLG